MLSVNSKTFASPFLKWAGGKASLLPQIMPCLPDRITSYFEPFLGGGAMLFYVLKRYSPNKVVASDLNPHLIATYSAIKNNPKEVIRLLKVLCHRYFEQGEETRKERYHTCRSYFNRIKQDQYNLDDTKTNEIASLFIFLNKTGFNGLYRENSRGDLNTSFGKPRGSSPQCVYTESNIYAVSELLQSVELLHCDYSQIAQRLRIGSFVYLDPPYRPISGTANFNSYNKSGFNDSHQQELAQFIQNLDKVGVLFLLSNSDPKNNNPADRFFDDLYSDFKISRITTKRKISGTNGDRGKEITEILVRNYD